MVDVSAVILAGGRGSRLGKPKATLRFGNVTLIERIVSELRREFDDIVVVAAPPDENQMLPDVAPARVLRDEIAYEGPLGALRIGLASAREDVVFACGCDQPLMRAELAAHL